MITSISQKKKRFRKVKKLELNLNWLFQGHKVEHGSVRPQAILFFLYHENYLRFCLEPDQAPLFPGAKMATI